MFDAKKIPLVTVGGVLVFWILDAAIDAHFFGQKPFLDALLHPGGYEVYIRTLVGGSLLAAGVVWSLKVRQNARVREILKATESHYRAVVDAYPEYTIVHTANRILFANRKTIELFGLRDVQDLAHRDFLDLVHPDSRESVAIGRASVLRSGEPTEPREVQLLLPHDKTLDVVLTTAPIEFEEQPALLSFISDISEYVETRRDLLASRERLSLALEAAQDGVWDWDIPAGRMIYNRSWARMLGLDLAEVSQDRSTWLSLIHPDDHLRAENLIQTHLRGEIPHYETEVRLRHKEGHYIWVLDRGKVVDRDPNGQPLRMTGTHRDITARKEAELALEIRNRIAEVFLTSSDQRIYIDTLELVCNATNSPAGLFGVLDVAGNLELRALRRDDDGQQIDPKPPERLQADQLPPLFQQVIRDLHSVIVDRPGQATGILDDATLLVVPVTTREQVIGVIGVAGRRQPYDSSDRTLLESLSGYLAPILQSRITSEAKATQLRQAQKMEALGALAGGIAHDFNNILQAIMGFTTLARDEIKPGSTTEKDLNRVLRATHRGQELVKRILLFSRRQEQDRQPVEMEAIVQEAVGLLRPSIPATIEVRTIIDPRTGMVLADPSQLSQVVLNLATNAYHAMETDGGVLEIEVGFQLADAQALDRPDFLLDKDLVVLTVRDNGCGMESEVLSRLYDPFFTTKEVGKGTGLGLSVVHGIVASHGGDIQIESDRGAGTTVRIMLPRLSQEAGEIEERSPSPEDDAPGGHILFVDDEDDIAAMGQALLEKQGFKVTVALNGATALDNLLADAHDYDLLITDLTMPRMTGLQLADKVAEVRPDLPVLLISGFGDRTDEALKTHPHIWGVINKPFGGETLRRTVKQTLQAAAERQSRSRADGE